MTIPPLNETDLISFAGAAAGQYVPLASIALHLLMSS